MAVKHEPQAIITEVVHAGDRVVLRSRTIRVEVVGGPVAGHVAELSGAELRVGSGAGMDLLLVDPSVSRHHLTIRLERDGLRIVDAQSRNGTTIEGVRVNDAFARHGAIVGAGATTFRLLLSSGTIDVPISSAQRFGGLLGGSIAMRRVFTVLERIAATDDTLLIEGETGTGKELAAEAVHEASRRHKGAFQVFDCSAVSQHLVESELFGHVRGAFTGAVQDRVGAFEAADGGTLFLDEVGELPLDVQPKLLRALERFEFRRVGTNAPARSDVRIVAATNKNLAEECARGRFREDLYYRLAVVRVALPPLRERLDDIELLARHFAAAHALRNRTDARLDEAMLKTLRGRSYPGNVRDLRNAVARALALGDPDGIPMSAPGRPANGAAQLEVTFDERLPFLEAREAMINELERTYLERALADASGNATRAAERIGVSRKFMQRAIAKYKLRGA